MPINGDWETGLRLYFAQDADISRVELDNLRPGRSGASVLFATPWALRGGQETKLQPELVKLANLSSRCNLEEEISNFRRFAEGTALVYGQKLARPPHIDRTGQGLGVFGYPLFEVGRECNPFYAMALADSDSAARALTTFLDKLMEWYGQPTSSVDGVPLNLEEAKLRSLFDNLKNLDTRLATIAEELLREITSRRLPGGLSRVHGDLHLENVLVERGGNRPYLIDFGSAMEPGSPCMDLARMECDLIYRLLPYDFTVDEIAAFEKAIWDGGVAACHPTVAGLLVAGVRGHAACLLGTPNAQVWFLVGRLLNGMRMLAGTWHEVIPYADPNRRAGILASLGVVAKRLEWALEGRSLAFNQAVSPLGKGTEDAEKSLRWLFMHRRYADAWALACELAKARTPPEAVICLLGALAGLSGGHPFTEVNKLFALRPKRLSNPALRGLKFLVDAMSAARTTLGALPKAALRDFARARMAFAQAKDLPFEGIAADQLARANMHYGDFEGAKVLFAQAIALKEKSGDEIGLATSLGGQALLHLRTLEYSRARKLFSRDLELSRSQHDVAAQVKIHNWLGQAILEEDLTNVLDALSHFRESMRLAEASRSTTYDPKLDIAFARLGCGFCFTRTESVSFADEDERAARAHFEQVGTRVAGMGIALMELLAGEIAFLRQEARTGSLRIQSGLGALLEAEGPLLFLDYGVRECRYLRRIDRREECRSVAAVLRSRLKVLKSLKIHETLADLENG